MLVSNARMSRKVRETNIIGNGMKILQFITAVKGNKRKVVNTVKEAMGKYQTFMDYCTFEIILMTFGQILTSLLLKLVASSLLMI